VTGEPLVQLTNISKYFLGVTALEDINFPVRRGEVMCLLGDNGAGKSTLIKILSGVHQQDRGTYWFDGLERRFSSPREAKAHGIATVYQDLSMIPLMSIARNFFLGSEPTRGLGPLRFFFLGENLQRFTGQIYESGSRPFWYQLAAFFSDFAPWSLLLFLAAWFDWRRAERERTSRSVTRILYLWLVYAVVLFSLASFKRDYYLLPAMPAAALIIGPLISNIESLPKFARRIVAGFLVICGVGLLAGALLSLRAAALLSVRTFLRFLPPVIALVGLALVSTWIRRRKTWQASLILAATIWATILSLQLVLLPAFVRYQPTAQLAAGIPAGRVVYTSRAADGWASSLAFNLPPPYSVERLSGDVDDQKLLDILERDPRAVAVIWEREYARLVQGDPALKIIARAETYGHGGLSLNLIRHPARQHLYLIGHDH